MNMPYFQRFEKSDLPYMGISPNSFTNFPASFLEGQELSPKIIDQAIDEQAICRPTFFDYSSEDGDFKLAVNPHDRYYFFVNDKCNQVFDDCRQSINGQNIYFPFFVPGIETYNTWNSNSKNISGCKVFDSLDEFPDNIFAKRHKALLQRRGIFDINYEFDDIGRCARDKIVTMPTPTRLRSLMIKDLAIVNEAELSESTFNSFQSQGKRPVATKSLYFYRHDLTSTDHIIADSLKAMQELKSLASYNCRQLGLELEADFDGFDNDVIDCLADNYLGKTHPQVELSQIREFAYNLFRGQDTSSIQPIIESKIRDLTTEIQQMFGDFV